MLSNRLRNIVDRALAIPRRIMAWLLGWLTTATAFLRVLVGALLLAVLAITVLRLAGVTLPGWVPLRGIGHVELAYLAGAYWLVK